MNPQAYLARDWQQHDLSLCACDSCTLVRYILRTLAITSARELQAKMLELRLHGLRQDREEK